MRRFKEFLPLPFIILTAYLGGLFFGNHPELIRAFRGQKTIVIGTMRAANTLPSTAVEYLRNHAVRNIEIRLIEEASKPALLGVDLLWLPGNELDLFGGNFKEPSSSQKELIDQNILREQDHALPVLWKLERIPSGKALLLRWMIADVSGSAGNQEIVAQFLTSDFQNLLRALNTGFLPSLENSLLPEELRLMREIPLADLEY